MVIENTFDTNQGFDRMTLLLSRRLWKYFAYTPVMCALSAVRETASLTPQQATNDAARMDSTTGNQRYSQSKSTLYLFQDDPRSHPEKMPCSRPPNEEGWNHREIQLLLPASMRAPGFWVTDLASRCQVYSISTRPATSSRIWYCTSVGTAFVYAARIAAPAICGRPKRLSGAATDPSRVRHSKCNSADIW